MKIDCKRRNPFESPADPTWSIRKLRLRRSVFAPFLSGCLKQGKLLPCIGFRFGWPRTIEGLDSHGTCHRSSVDLHGSARDPETSWPRAEKAGRADAETICPDQPPEFPESCAAFHAADFEAAGRERSFERRQLFSTGVAGLACGKFHDEIPRRQVANRIHPVDQEEICRTDVSIKSAWNRGAGIFDGTRLALPQPDWAACARNRPFLQAGTPRTQGGRRGCEVRWFPWSCCLARRIPRPGLRWQDQGAERLRKRPVLDPWTRTA